MAKTYTVKRDGDVKFTGSEEDCFAYIHKHSSCSVDWACKHEGWQIVEAYWPGGGVSIDEADFSGI